MGGLGSLPADGVPSCFCVRLAPGHDRGRHRPRRLARGEADALRERYAGHGRHAVVGPRGTRTMGGEAQSPITPRLRRLQEVVFETPDGAQRHSMQGLHA